MVTRASSLWALWIALWVGSVAGCREVPATQLLVVVDSDLTVDRELNRIEVAVTDPSDPLGRTVFSQRDFTLLPTPRPAAYSLPLSFGLVPINGDASRRVRVTVTAYTVDTNRRIELTAIAGFLPDRKLLLTMFLQRACVGIDHCDPGFTCIDGGCQAIPQPTLPDITGQTSLDASGLFDVTRTEASVDASLDAPEAPVVPDVPVVSDVPVVPDVPVAMDVPVDSGVDAPDVPVDAPVLPTPQPILPTTGALTNTRLLWFEFRATAVPAGTTAAIELCGSPDFAAADTATVTPPAPTTTAGVSTWDLVSLDADELRATSGPIGSNRTLWWRARLSLPSGATTRSAAWPFRLRPAQSARAGNVTGLQRFRAIGQAGDFNGDGASDVFIVTARSGVSNGGNFALGRRFSRASESVVHVSQRTLDFGRGARLGDLDGDGLEDFGVASGFPTGTGDSGAVYLVTGTTATADRTPELVPSTRSSPTTNPALMAAVMDSDRDGLGEFVVALPSTGTVRLYRGAAAARSGVFQDFAPSVAGAEPEMSLSTAGDVNGDGRGDFVVGHPSQRSAELFLATDLGGVAGYTRAALPSTGLGSDAGYGASVAGGGDLNGDGFSDVVVAGTAGLRVFFGGVGGVAASSTFVDPSPCFGRANDATPRRVANLGDLNGDGGDELGFAYVGACMIVLRAPVSAASTAPALAEARTLFAATGESTFASTLAAAGDYDGDGLADFSLAIPNLTDGSRSTVKVYFGDPVAWAQGMSGDGGVAPAVMTLTPGSTGWGYSVAAIGGSMFAPVAWGS